jgi:hypothetical protein
VQYILHTCLRQIHHISLANFLVAARFLTMMHAEPYRDNVSQADLQDYYDTIPVSKIVSFQPQPGFFSDLHSLPAVQPPHRLSGTHSAFSSTQDIPLTTNYPAAVPSYMPPPRHYSSLAAPRDNQWPERTRTRSKWIVRGQCFFLETDPY